MDRTLQAAVRLDVVSDLVRIDVRGYLTQESRPALAHIIQRIRHMGVTAHIRVDLFRALTVESAALSGLCKDLNAIDGGASGVSLAMMPSGGNTNPRGGTRIKTLEIAGDFVASMGPSGSRPLADYSYDELLAASDSVFGMLDDPEAIRGSDLLAEYNAIGSEIARREAHRGLHE